MDIQTIKGVVENLNEIERAQSAMNSIDKGKVEGFSYCAFKTQFRFQFLSPDAHKLFEKALSEEKQFEKDYLRELVDSDEQ